MYQLFETIAIYDGKIQNIELHNERYEKSFRTLYNKEPQKALLYNIELPEDTKNGVYKMKIYYNDNSKKVEFEKYNIKDIKTLMIVEDNKIEYGMKYVNRDCIDILMKKKGDCDDILIVKNNNITDSSIANIVFFDGVQWITPKTILLNGTARQKLIRDKKIVEQIITLDDIYKFKAFKLINALRNFDVIVPSMIENIKTFNVKIDKL